MKKKIVFIGGKDVGLETIQALLDRSEELSFIFCLLEDEHESKKYHQEIKALAQKKRVPIKITKTIKSDEELELLRGIKPDLMIVFGWRTILPNTVFNIPTFGTVAIHFSLLPKYRGFAPINWAIINGEKVTGATIFYLNDGAIDSGNIVDQIKVPILITDTADDVYEKTKVAAVKILIKNLDNLKLGIAKSKKQNEKIASYTCARIPDDGEINWQKSTIEVYNLIRGLSSPYPGAFTHYNGKKLIIQKASLVKNPPNFVGRIAGRVVRLGGSWVDVLTGDGLIRLEEIEIEGQGKCSASEVIHSIKTSLGRLSYGRF